MTVNDIAFIFPGQGSQSVGMGKDLHENFVEARYVFEEVDNTLEQNLSEMMFNGPADELQLTENAQPALMCVSMAIVRILEREMGINLHKTARFVAGHSLGEYSALAAVGTFSLADTAFLLKRRGKAMQDAVPVGQGGMTAVIGLDIDEVKQLAEQATEQARQEHDRDDLICVVANDNAPGQVVISGHMETLDIADQLGNDAGAKKMIRLPVSAPFHSPLMAPAATQMKTAFNNIQSRDAAVDLVANVTARPIRDADTIVAQLIEQITDPVRWRESVEYMAGQGVSTAVEVGAGGVLSGLIRRIDRSINTVSLNTPDGLDKFARDYA